MSLDDYFAAQDAEQAAQQHGISWDEWRARYTWQTTEYTREAGDSWREHTITVHRASSLLDGLIEPAGFREIDAWSDYPYRRVWLNDELRIILTYCEGDLDFTEHADANTYHQAKKHCAAFYRKH